MSKIILWLYCLGLAGCTFLRVSEPPRTSGVSPKAFILSRIENVRVGMSYGEVVAILGKTITIGYERRDRASDVYSLITISNPYRQESVRYSDKTYDVFYCFTRVRVPDGIVSDDELTPLVFERGILIGKGWNFLNALKQ